LTASISPRYFLTIQLVGNQVIDMAERERHRPHDAAAARRAILAAAEEIFARDGFGGARVDAIAQKSGYNKSLIFQYFEDKLGLYGAVIRCLKEQLHAQLFQLLDAATAEHDALLDAQCVRTFIQTAVRMAFDFHQAHPQATRMLSWEMGDCWRTFNVQRTTQDDRQWPVALRDYLRRAQTAGILRADLDPAVLIASIMGTTLIYHASLARYRALFPDADLTAPEALARAREQMVKLVLRGTMVDPEEAPLATGI
jgi:TetR/AcrR family transcriptional regulator